MKQLLGAATLAMAIGDPAIGQSMQPPAQGPVRVRVRRPAPPLRDGTEALVPLKLVGGLPVVALMVNGRGPFQFAVDTGQPFAVSVTSAAMDRMGLAKTGEMLMGDPSGAASHAITTFEMDSLSLGAITFRHVEGSAAAMSRPGQDEIDGTVGIGLFEGLMPTIDYGRLTFELKAGSLPPANARDIVDAAMDEMGLISVPVSIGERTEQVHLDTGNARAALFMPAERIASLPTRGKPRDAGVARTISREVTIKSINLAAPVHVGTTNLPVTAVSYPSIAPVGNLGSLGLAGMVVTIDLPDRRVRIVPSG